LAKKIARRASRSTRKESSGPSRFDGSAKGLDDLIGYRLRLAYNVQVQRFASVGAPFNIRPPQFAILKLVYYNPRLRQKDLAEALKQKHANVVTLLDELESRKLLTRVPDRKDKRSRVLHLTPSGRRLIAKLLERHARLYRNLKETLGERQVEQLSKLLDAFRELDRSPDIDRVN
jgi:DNA-binding MarR family transcriptional regulator